MRFKTNNTDRNNLKIMALGGFGSVTQNLFVYEYQDNILIVDCGVGFKEEKGKEGLVIPDFTYLLQNRKKIRGIVFTHGHEDHIGGLPYLLSKIQGEVPLYAPRLTKALIEEKFKEKNIRADVTLIDSNTKLNLKPFLVEFMFINHSIPDTFHFFIKTPCGNVYHGSDFKFDWTPVINRQSEIGKIALAGNQGIDLLLSDCLRSERKGYTLSESMVEESLDREIRKCKGKFFITTISSNISRWQQALNVISRYHRKAVLVGRSVEKVLTIAQELGYLKVPKDIIVPIKKAHFYRDNQLAFLIAGCQAQEGSALDRLASGKSQIKIKPKDKVVFSADYIPGNEAAIRRLVDKLSLIGADVSYSDISNDLHVSGHGSQSDLALLISLTGPKYLLPIGGAFRQMKQYSILACKMGYDPNRILLPKVNQVIEMSSDGRVKLGQTITLQLKFIPQ